MVLIIHGRRKSIINAIREEIKQSTREAGGESIPDEDPQDNFMNVDDVKIDRWGFLPPL